MGFLDDILGGAQRLSIGEDGGDPIVVDASAREVHNVSGQVSDHPVEKGVDIVDHYRVLPRGLEIEGIVTNTPIVSGLPGETLVNSLVGLVQGDTDPASNAWNELNRFFDEAVVVVIVTSLKTYENMVLTDLTVTRNTKQAQGIFFVASAREISFVSTEAGEAIPISPTGQKKKSAGKKTNNAANDAQGTQSSALLKAFQGAGVLR